jgi:chromosome segregation ATPase
MPDFESKFDAHVADEDDKLEHIRDRLRSLESSNEMLRGMCNTLIARQSGITESLRTLGGNVNACLKASQEAASLGNANLHTLAKIEGTQGEFRGKLESLSQADEVLSARIIEVRAGLFKQDSDISALKRAEAERDAADTAVQQRDAIVRARHAEERAIAQFRMSFVPWAIAILSAVLAAINWVIKH